MIGNSIHISAHILDHLEEDGRGYTVIAESIAYVNNIRCKFSSIDFDVVVGVDANATLPPNYDEITGDLVLTPASSHTPQMARMILSWFAALGVRALNTFSADGKDSEECSSQGVPDARSLWTCGTKRKLPKRTQIDFVGVSSRVKGESPAAASFSPLEVSRDTTCSHTLSLITVSVSL